MLERFIAESYPNHYLLYSYDNKGKIFYEHLPIRDNMRMIIKDGEWEGLTLEELIDKLPIGVRIIKDEAEVEKLLTMMELIG